jgi:hypothetical protein
MIKLEKLIIVGPSLDIRPMIRIKSATDVPDLIPIMGLTSI